MRQQANHQENIIEELKRINADKDITIEQLRDESETYRRNYEVLSSKNPDSLLREHNDLMHKYDLVTDELEKLKIE